MMRIPNPLAVLMIASCLNAILLAQRTSSDREAARMDAMIELKLPGAPALSPDGRYVAYTVREANWEENAFETEIWLADAGGGSPRPLTAAKRSSRAPAWSPDGRWIAFISDRSDKRQIYLIPPDGGEAVSLTSHEEGVTAFAWSPDGRLIAYSATDPKSAALKEREKMYGEFEVVGQEPRLTRLHVIDTVSRKSRRLTEKPSSVGAFAWSPDSTSLAFDHRTSDDAADDASADISIVQVADGNVRPLVTQAGQDSNPFWSPDGTQVVFRSAMTSRSYFFANRRLAIVPVQGGVPRVLAGAFDENATVIEWGSDGIYFSASDRVWSSLYRLDPRSDRVLKLGPDKTVATAFTLSRDRSMVAYVGSDAQSLPEIYAGAVSALPARRLTTFDRQLDGWAAHTREVISWKSADGTVIEGVLHKPAGFEPGKRYPLLLAIHGGPATTSRPSRMPYIQTYPIDLWLSKGAVVLEPNYRGSAGYGEAFRSLGVRNMGIGDAWDVLSGVDHLVALGIVDKDCVATMGWSQGGYISAFLATRHSDRLKAASVGAGISDWTTYYGVTDIPDFTRQYLQATPWENPEIYDKTSPVSYLKNARTPVLIQHGDQDLRVPIANAYELYRGLHDHKVPVKLVVYKGFAHGLLKPKAVRAAMRQNVEWLAVHFWPAGNQ